MIAGFPKQPSFHLPATAQEMAERRRLLIQKSNVLPKLDTGVHRIEHGRARFDTKSPKTIPSNHHAITMFFALLDMPPRTLEPESPR
jgi:hypothetical protein